jgi:hypothetical protein
MPLNSMSVLFTILSFVLEIPAFKTPNLSLESLIGPVIFQYKEVTDHNA